MSTTHLFRRALLLPLLALLVIGCVTDESAYVDRVSTPRRAAQGARGVGVFLGGASMSNYEGWLGRRVSHVGAYASQQSWTAFDRSSWRHWTGSGKQLVLGVPMLVRSPSGSLARGAGGAYDDHFRRLAHRLVAEGHSRAILRLGWEFNGDWFPWRSDRDPKAFAAYWRRIVTTMRAVPGAAGLRFDWNPGHGPRFVDVNAYPGDKYVDIIGFDLYDRSYGDRMRDPVARWNNMVHRPYGLEWLRNFAAAHGKTISFPEWAVTHNHVRGVAHDNPVFIRGMAEFIRTNNVEFSLYFDVLAHDGDFRLRSFPQSAAAYRALF
jgi:Glycosyl hydrolase family 26